MAIHDNWKAALSQMETAHKKLCDRFALAGEGTKGDIQIKMDMLEDSVTELTTKITKHEADNGVVPQNTHFPLQVSTQTQKCIASLSQSIETFLELETLIARDPSVSRTSLRDFNKYSNELAAFFVVPFGKKIMDSDELKKAYFNDTLFNKIASGTTLGVADNAHLDTLFNDADTAPAYHRSVITSALTLGLMHSYDAQKAIRLINIINDGERFVWKRALVGLTVALMDKQDQLNDGVVRRLEGLKEKPSVQKEFLALSEAFEKLEDEMAFIQKLSGLFKLDECFEFFETPAHWFLPFYAQNDVIKTTTALREPLRTLLTESRSWSLDVFKYAFCKNYHTFDDYQKMRIIEIIEKEKKDMNEAYHKELAKDYPNTSPMTAAQLSQETPQYLHELCFFSRNAPKDKFKDILNQTANFYEMPLLEFALSQTTLQKIMANKANQFFNKGYDYDKQRNYAEAIKSYAEAVKHKPDKHEAWNNMGIIFGKQGDNLQAINCCQEAIKHKPDLSQAWGNLGFLFLVMGQVQESKDALLKAIEYGDTIEGNMNLGHIYLSEQKEAEAMDSYMIAIQNIGNVDDFWTGFDDDYQHLVQYGIDHAYYQSIKARLQERGQ